MKLLNTKSLRVSEFPHPMLPSYAIASHIWSDGEITFAEFQNGSGKEKAGYAKLLSFCRLAVEDAFDWLWIDCCCINPASSSELSEAINSMYRIFRDAGICYTYLPDVDSDGQGLLESRHWTRSWTLQELVAPGQISFYSRDWTWLGDNFSLSDALMSATGISADILTGERALDSAPVAERLSWTIHRQATRHEDIVYSLLGLFDIAMPLQYGEGSFAVTRFREFLLKSFEDYSVLLWSRPLVNFIIDHQHQSLPLPNYNTLAVQCPEWSQLTSHSPVRLSSWSFAKHLTDRHKDVRPPEITVRGARMTLFTRSLNDDLICWSYCTQRVDRTTFALCVRVKARKDNTPTGVRYDQAVLQGEICYVAVNRLKGFEATDISFSLLPAHGFCLLASL